MKKFLYAMAAISFMSLMSCSSGNGEEPVAPAEENTENVYEDEVVEVRGPITLTAREQAVNDAASDFALDYFRFSTKGGSSCVVSPLSLNGCLALIANGASGATRDEIVNAIGSGNITFDDCNSYWKVLSQDIPAVSADDKVAVVNSAWTNSMVNLKDSYMSDIKNLLKADCVVFADGSIKDQINSYVEKRTRGMITGMLESEPVDNGMILLNTLYFNSIWRYGFSKTSVKEPFYNIDNTQTDVDMMETGRHSLRYTADGSAEYVSVPFGLNKFEMLLIVPEKGIALDEVVSGISSAKLSALNGKMDNKDLIVRIPLFTLESKDDGIISFLKSKGVTKAFGKSEADFGNMLVKNDGFWINMMLQKSKVKADEEGFTGASVTLGTIIGSDIDNDNHDAITVNADRPFAFIVREVKSGIILFIGQVTKF